MCRYQRCFLCLLIFCAAIPAPAVGQDWTLWQGPQYSPRLRAQLRDKSENAQNHIAAVEVEVANAWLDYPSVAPQQGIRAAVLKIQMDGWPSILTTDTRLRFAQLSSGQHTISVQLVGENNRLISPAARLSLEIR